MVTRCPRPCDSARTSSPARSRAGYVSARDTVRSTRAGTPPAQPEAHLVCAIVETIADLGLVFAPLSSHPLPRRSPPDDFLFLDVLFLIDGILISVNF